MCINKGVFYSLFLLVMSFLCSCTKSSDDGFKKKSQRNYFQVWAIGADTSKTNIMSVNSVPAPIITEDAYLKTKILSYTDGKFFLEVTNKQNCQADFELSYEGTVVSKVLPSRKNNINFNHIPPNKTEVFEITGTSKVGAIKVKALTICNWQGQPQWLTNVITITTLPINFTDVQTTKKSDGDYVVAFTIDDPGKISTIEIRQGIDGKTYKITRSITCDKTTRIYKEVMKPL